MHLCFSPKGGVQWSPFLFSLFFNKLFFSCCISRLLNLQFAPKTFFPGFLSHPFPYQSAPTIAPILLYSIFFPPLTYLFSSQRVEDFLLFSVPSFRSFHFIPSYFSIFFLVPFELDFFFYFALRMLKKMQCTNDCKVTLT